MPFNYYGFVLIYSIIPLFCLDFGIPIVSEIGMFGLVIEIQMKLCI